MLSVIVPPCTSLPNDASQAKFSPAIKIFLQVFNLHTLWVKFVSCATAVGSGLPVGPEGPMVHIGESNQAYSCSIPLPTNASLSGFLEDSNRYDAHFLFRNSLISSQNSGFIFRLFELVTQMSTLQEEEQQLFEHQNL